MPTNPNPFLRSSFDAVADQEAIPVEPVQAPPAAALPSMPAIPMPARAPAVAPTPVAPAARPAASLAPPPELRGVFEASAREFDVPVNILMALAHQESGYDPLAIGQPTKWGRAKGMMQNLDATADGLGINPLDPNEAIPAAAKQIRERLDKGYSMADAVKEHFAGPDRAGWKDKTHAYGDEVLVKAGEIGKLLYADDPAEGAAPANKAVAGEPEKQNRFSAALPRADYYANFIALNPTATPDAIQAAMAQYDVDAAARTKAGGNRVQNKFAEMASPEATFNAKLNAKLQAKNKGVVQVQPGNAQPANPAMPAPTRERPDIVDQAKGDFGRGIENLKALGYGAAGLAADASGEDAAATDFLTKYVAIENETAKTNPATIGTYKNVKSLGDAGRYAIEAVAENLPMLLPSLATGGVGAQAAKVAAQRLVVGMVEKQVASGIARAVAEQQAAKFVARTIMAGSLAGAAPASIAMESGSIMGDIYKDTGKKAAGTSLAFGIPAGLLDSLEPVMALRKIAGPLVDDVAGGIIKRLGVEAGKQFIVESGTEGLQTILEEAAKTTQNGKQLLTQDLLDQVIDATLKGGIGGAGIGMASQGVHEARSAITQAANSPARQVANEINRQVDEVNFVGTDAAARGGMDPNNESIDPRQTTMTPEQRAARAPAAPAPAPAPAPAAPAGPLSAAVHTAAPAAAETFAIEGDDGTVHTFDGENIVPAGPLAGALGDAAASHAEAPIAAPEILQAPPEPPPVESLHIDDLRAQLQQVAGQIKQGRTAELVAKRKELEKEINARAKEAAAETAKLAEEPTSNGPFDTVEEANAMAPRVAEKTAVVHEVVKKGDKFILQPYKEAGDGNDTVLPQGTADGSGSDRTAAGTGPVDAAGHQGSAVVPVSKRTDASRPVEQVQPGAVRAGAAEKPVPALKAKKDALPATAKTRQVRPDGVPDAQPGAAVAKVQPGAALAVPAVDAAPAAPALNEWETNPYHARQFADEGYARKFMAEKRVDGDKFEPVQIAPARWKVVPKAAPTTSVADLTGDKIDKEWHAFAEDSGTLNIDRADMPQVKAEHRGALTQFLLARGIAHEQTEMPAGDLKPTQREFSPAKVQKARDFEGGDRSILVSSDNHVLDGHHQWLAKMDGNEPVKVIKLDAPIKTLLAEVKEFPSAEVRDGATAAAPAAEKVPEVAPVAAPPQAEPKAALKPKKTRKADIESTAQGMLATAIDNKAAAFKQVKALRAKLKESPISDKGAIRFELLKATDRWNEFKQMERDANAGIEADAARHGVTLADIPSSRTIEVDSVRRPIENSRGQLVAQDFAGQVAFWKWFGASAAVDEHGRPRVLFHGTTNADKILESGFKKGWTQLSDSKVVSDSYQDWKKGDNAATLEVYAKVQNPAYYDAKGQKYTEIGNKVFRATDDALRAGHDAIIIQNIRDHFDSSVPTKPHTTVVVFSPDQIKSATANNGTFDPSDANITHDVADETTRTLMADGPLSRLEEPKRVMVLAELKRLQKLQAAGKMTAEAYRVKVDALIGKIGERNTARENAKAVDRERGADWVEERLMRAKRQGDLDAATVDFALWALRKSPSLAADLAISIRSKNANGTAGSYSSAARLMTLITTSANEGTAVHEMLHHTERMMPAAIQGGIAKAWLRAYTDAWTKADAPTRTLLEDLMAAGAGDKKAFERTVEAFAKGKLDYDAHYQLVNASEFWAVNATRIMAGRFDAATRGWAPKAKQWLSEMVQYLKGAVGLKSDAPILKGLKEVLNGDGTRVSSKMLGQLPVASDIARQTESAAFKRWFGSSKAVGKDGKPLVLYHGTTADIGEFKPGTSEHNQGIFFTNSARIASTIYANGGAGVSTDSIKSKLEGMDGFGTATPTDDQMDAAWAWADSVRKRNRYFAWEPEDDGRTYAEQVATYLSHAAQDGFAGEEVTRLVGEVLGVSVAKNNEGANVVPAFLSMQNPLEIDGSRKSFDDNEQADWIAQAKEEGRDGVIIRNYDDGGTGGLENYKSAGRHTVYIAFKPSQVKSAVGNNGNFDPSDDFITHDIPAPAGPAPAVDISLTPPEQGLLRRVQSAVQNNLNRVRQVQDRIAAVSGVPVSPVADYYGAETNRPGRIAARLEDAQDKLTGPLMERLAKSGYTPAQLNDLLHAMHASERNEAVAKINPDFPDGGSGMTDDQANAILAEYEGAAELHEIADQARSIAAATLDLKLAYGLITADQHELLSDMYEHYVPLKGDGEYGPKIKRAMGHEGRDEFIMENIARDYAQAVVVGEKNLARQSLLQMVLRHPDHELWTARVPPKGRYVAGTVLMVKKGDSTVASFTSTSQVSAFLEAKGAEAGQYTVETSAGEQVVEFTKPLQDNEVMVYVRGQAVRLQIHDEKLASQLRPLNNGQMNVVMEAMRGLNRHLSKVYTGYNPAFILRNTARDALTGTINMVGNEGAGIAAKAWTKYPAALATLVKWAHSKQVPDGVTGDYLREYRDHGGKVGASWMSDLEQQGKSLTEMYDDAAGLLRTAKTDQKARTAALVWRKTVGKLAHVIEVLNQGTENALRLSLFIALRQAGQTPGKAAQAAKSVTVDFDRKGTATPALGAFYLFLNPAIQGTANAARTLTQGAHKGQAWAALGGLASLGFLLAARGMDDDKDRWLGEGWEVRTKNFMLRVGDHQIKIPVSQEFAPFFAMGTALAEASRGESKMTTSVRLVSSFIDAYFPLNGTFRPDSDNHALDLRMAIMPTVGRPYDEIASNRSAFGSALFPETEQTKDRPDNLKMNRGTKNSPYDKAAQGIAAVGAALGSRPYENDPSKVSPETLKLLWRTYTGGLGAFIADATGYAGMAMSDASQIESGDVPIVKDFWRPVDIKPIQGRFYDLEREVKAVNTEFKLAAKAGDGDAVQKLAADPEKARVLGLTSMIAQLNKAAGQLADQAVDTNADKSLTGAEKRAKLKAIDVQREQLYRTGIAAFK